MSNFSEWVKIKKKEIWKGELQKTYRLLQHYHKKYPVVSDDLKDKIQQIRDGFAILYTEREKNFKDYIIKEEEEIKNLRIESMKKEIDLIKDNK